MNILLRDDFPLSLIFVEKKRQNNVMIMTLFFSNDFCYWVIDVGTGNYLNISILHTDDEYGSDPGGLTVYDGKINPQFSLFYIHICNNLGIYRSLGIDSKM